jgi:hypothetical protein
MKPNGTPQQDLQKDMQRTSLIKLMSLEKVAQGNKQSAGQHGSQAPQGHLANQQNRTQPQRSHTHESIGNNNQYMKQQQ